MNDELIPLEPVEEVAPEPFVVSEALQAALNDAHKVIQGRTFADRHPELGKMFKCQVCGTRHRKNERKCEQVFTYAVKDKEGRLYQQLREANGQLVPNYRTAVRPDENPTKKQIVGRAAFAKKRFHPHPSRIKLQFIERTRQVFEEMGFPLERREKEEIKDFKETFQKNLQRARVEAARRLRRERKLSDRAYRRRADEARRINHGFQVKVRV
jgi:hypothetical protein